VNDSAATEAPQAGPLDRLSPPTALAVPNVSEGRDPAVLKELVSATESSGAQVVNLHSDADHHRSVLTVVGDPMALIDAMVALGRACVELIDLRRHEGVHPRVGALDVVPVVALEDRDLPLVIETAVALAGRLGEELELPVFRYGAIASSPERARPADFRRHGYDWLDEQVREGHVVPDAGPGRLHPTAGGVLVGARPPLIAWNVWLDEGSLADARALAALIRESDGGLPGVRALGLYLPGAAANQVSMNLEDYRRCPPRLAMDTLRREAERLGVRLGRSELVGLIPRAALEGASTTALGLTGFTPAQVLEARVPSLRRD
jgi:glutamate formiminotransferase